MYPPDMLVKKTHSKNVPKRVLKLMYLWKSTKWDQNMSNSIWKNVRLKWSFKRMFKKRPQKRFRRDAWSEAAKKRLKELFSCWRWGWKWNTEKGSQKTVFELKLNETGKIWSGKANKHTWKWREARVAKKNFRQAHEEWYLCERSLYEYSNATAIGRFYHNRDTEDGDLQAHAKERIQKRSKKTSSQ